MNFATLHFDTYKVVNLLTERGYSKEQAEGFIQAVQEVTISGVATREDLDELEKGLRSDVVAVQNEVQNARHDLRGDIANLKIWFLAGLLTQTVAVIGLVLTFSS